MHRLRQKLQAWAAQSEPQTPCQRMVGASKTTWQKLQTQPASQVCQFNEAALQYSGSQLVSARQNTQPAHREGDASQDPSTNTPYDRDMLQSAQ